MDSKSPKPSKQELLRELESIRDSLLPEGGTTAAAMNTSLSNTQRTPVIKNPSFDTEEYDYALNIPAVTEPTKNYHLPAATRTPAPLAPQPEPEPLPEALMNVNDAAPTQEDLPMNTLPGQQSLFDTQEMQLEIEKPVSSKQTPVPATPKAAVENPFLPKHIKDKLDKERLLYQQEVNAPSYFRPSSTTNHVPKSAEEKLIDDLVNSYLPKIKEELRRRLRETLHPQDSD